MTPPNAKRGAAGRPRTRKAPKAPNAQGAPAAPPKPPRAPEWESRALAEAYGWQKERYAAHMARLADLVTAQLEEWGVVV